MIEDARALQARTLHKAAAAADSDAELCRQQRDRLVRALRNEDPVRWSYRKLAAAVGCSKALIQQILEHEEART